MTDLDQLAADLRRLPALALEAMPSPARQLPDLSGSHPAPGSKVPAGVNLDHVDASQGRQHARLLVQLAQCTRVVLEKFPNVAPQPERETWPTLTDWLLGTMHAWRHDEWCVDWIADEVRQIVSDLQGILRANVDRYACPFCGVRLDAHTTDMLMVATCPACERVVGMRPRVSQRRWEELQTERLRARVRRMLKGS